jgi:hypothetical protein
MRNLKRSTSAFTAVLVTIGSFALFAGVAQAHCDSTSGPVIPEAKAALATGNVTPILKWVAPENEAEVRRAFASAVAVRGQGDEARALADQYFLETLVRLHRAGEGAPYTGISNAPVEPIIALTDAAIKQGSPEDLLKKLTAHLETALKAKFDKVVQAEREKDKSVEAGRRFVAAYVDYTHYVEGIHAALTASEHHHAQAAEAHK